MRIEVLRVAKQGLRPRRPLVQQLCVHIQVNFDTDPAVNFDPCLGSPDTLTAGAQFVIICSQRRTNLRQLDRHCDSHGTKLEQVDSEIDPQLGKGAQSHRCRSVFDVKLWCQLASTEVCRCTRPRVAIVCNNLRAIWNSSLKSEIHRCRTAERATRADGIGQAGTYCHYFGD